MFRRLGTKANPSIELRRSAVRVAGYHQAQGALVSQLDLALRAEVSARHLSFIETGRSRPTSEMIIRLAQQLDVPLRERNVLLLSGGYAPAYPANGLADPPMSAVHEAIEHVLRAHEPLPAVVIDARWDLVAANDAVPLLTEGASETLLEPPVNVLRLSMHPEGMASRIVNLAEWRAHLLHRLNHDIEAAGDPALIALRDELATYPSPPPATRPDTRAILVPLRVRVRGAVLVHVGADAGLGFDIGGGVGIETDGFCGAAVIHGSGKDQVSKGHFLIGDGIADSIFGHRSSRSLVWVGFVCCSLSDTKGLRAAVGPSLGSLGAGVGDFGTGIE